MCCERYAATVDPTALHLTIRDTRAICSLSWGRPAAYTLCVFCDCAYGASLLSVNFKCSALSEIFFFEIYTVGWFIRPSLLYRNHDRRWCLFFLTWVFFFLSNWIASAVREKHEEHMKEFWIGNQRCKCKVKERNGMADELLLSQTGCSRGGVVRRCSCIRLTYSILHLDTFVLWPLCKL